MGKTSGGGGVSGPCQNGVEKTVIGSIRVYRELSIGKLSLFQAFRSLGKGAQTDKGKTPKNSERKKGKKYVPFPAR